MLEIMKDFFVAINVWRRLDDGRLVHYRCFQLVPRGGYCVQSADFYSLPIDQDRRKDLENQFLELLVEQPPNLRSGVFPTLEEAIARHDADFE